MPNLLKTRLGFIADRLNGLMHHADLSDASDGLADAVRRQLSKPGRGKVYRSKRGGGLTHQASAPGDPPAPDTKELLKSVRSKSRLGRAEVSVTHPAASALEYGSSSLNLLPRPYMRPARAEAEGQMTDALVRQLRRNVISILTG